MDPRWLKARLAVYQEEAGDGTGGSAGGTGSTGGDKLEGDTGGDTGGEKGDDKGTQDPKGNDKGDAGKGGEKDPGKGAGGDKGAGDDKGEATKWAPDWREKVAAGDDAKLKRLARYASPDAALDALFQLQNKIGSGELRAKLPKNATPEQMGEWRQANGIPESPEKYELKLADGLVIGEEDKPYVDAFLARVHAKDVTNEQASAFVNAYYDIVAQQTQERHEKDREIAQATEDELRQEWGADYRRNSNVIQNLLATAPSGLGEELLHGRMSDGTPIGASPKMLRWLASIALDINPHSTVVSAANGDIAGSIDTQIADIEKTMRENRQAYNADEKMQARYRELLTAREKVQAKAK